MFTQSVLLLIFKNAHQTFSTPSILVGSSYLVSSTNSSFSTWLTSGILKESIAVAQFWKADCKLSAVICWMYVPRLYSTMNVNFVIVNNPACQGDWLVSRNLEMEAQSCPTGAFKLSHDTLKWKPKTALSGRARCRTQPDYYVFYLLVLCTQRLRVWWRP